MHRIFQTTRPLGSETGAGDDNDVGKELTGSRSP